MYTPTQFREERPEIMLQAIRDIQFGALITATAEGYHASHVPVLLRFDDGAVVLESHVARANAHWTALTRPRNSLAVFQGPHAYISPSWYETKRRHGKVVPTWNYVAVHAHGMLEVVEDEAWLLALLNDLTNANEGHRDNPWTVTDAPADYIRGLTRAIVGLRLRVDRLEGSWKMNQHRIEADRRGTIVGLSASPRPDDRAVADIMRGLEATRDSSDA